jgi:hypothetical protein
MSGEHAWVLKAEPVPTTTGIGQLDEVRRRIDLLERGPEKDAERALDTAACIWCGACVWWSAHYALSVPPIGWRYPMG